MLQEQQSALPIILLQANFHSSLHNDQLLERQKVLSKMKSFLLVFLLLIPFASAIDVSVLQKEYLAGETVQVFVNATELSSSDIVLLDVNKSALSIIPLFTEYREGQFFVSFDLSETYAEGEYTLQIQSAEDTFQIIPRNGEAVLRLKPAFTLLDAGDDTFHFQVLNIEESSTTLYLFESDNSLTVRKNELSINPNEEKNIYVDYVYSHISSDLFLNVSYADQYYIFPVIYPDLVVEQEIVEEENATEEVIVSETEEIPFVFLVTKPEVVLSLAVNTSKYGDLKVQNTGNENLSLTYSLTEDLSFLVSFNESTILLLPGDIYTQRVWFNRENSSRVGEYTGNIVLSDGNFEQSIAVSVTIEEDFSQGDTLEDQGIEIVYEGETLAETESGRGVYILGAILIAMLLALIILVAFKLRQKDERKFKEFIEETKRKK